MNKIIIANYRETEPQVISREGNSFARKCAASFVEVEPGRYAYGYHYHEVNEEVFYIIRGHAVVRTPEGEKNLKEGDAIAFPASPECAPFSGILKQHPCFKVFFRFFHRRGPQENGPRSSGEEGVRKQYYPGRMKCPSLSWTWLAAKAAVPLKDFKTSMRKLTRIR